MTEFTYLQVAKDEQIGMVKLNRPHVLNALNREMVREIIAALEQLDRDDEIRTMMISGNGRAFAAGADIEEMAYDHAIQMELLNQFADWDRLFLLKKPLIGAVHGFVLGGGFELALACDVLFAAEGTQFGFPEVNLGVMPGAGGTQLLTKQMGRKKALEWLLSGAMMSAKEAKAGGFLNRVIAPELLMEEAYNFAKTIAQKPPLSIRLIKEAVNKAVDYSLYEGMQYERKNFYLLFASEDQKEGMKAFIEKRTPHFKGS